jgi:osmotically-inducible protein OsmY
MNFNSYNPFYRPLPSQQQALAVLLAFAAGAAFTYGAAWLAPRARRRLRRPVGEVRAADDSRLRQQVRSRIDELVSHPRAVEVEVDDGVVRVSGQVLQQELDGLLSRLTAEPGVRRVRNALATLTDPSGFGEARIPA